MTKQDKASLKRIKVLSKLVKGPKVLDIGCRESIMKESLGSDIEYYGLDVNDDESFTGDEKFKVLPNGISNPEAVKVFGDTKFDTVILAETLEHLLDPYAALQNVKELLRPGGILVGSTPNAVGWRYYFLLEVIGDGMIDFKNPKWDGHEHYYTFNTYILRTLFMRAGFSVESIKEWGNWIPHTGIFMPWNFRGCHIIFVAKK